MTPSRKPFSATPVFIGLFAVTAIFGLDLGVLWSLNKIGGAALQANVHATINRLGGNIVVASAGLMGCFLAIALTALGMFYLVMKLQKA